MFNVNYNPDVLTCLANLSSDEVFTPPNVANEMLDQLPEKLWRDKNTTFLDPCTKSGIFLREITKRLLVGLQDEIPDLQERINHILSKQVFGIGITELTTLVARRSLYCSRNANQEFSITDAFSNNDGNIYYKNIEHTWKNLKCIYCGASKDLYNRKDFLEQHAYNFIHTDNPKELINMKFDVIIGNPPYQISDGGAGASAKPLYHLFVENAIKLNPSYVTMIIPSRWFAGGKGLEAFRSNFLKSNKISHLVDFPDASDCFPSSVEIKGGVCYFLWNKNHNDICKVSTSEKGEIISQKSRLLLEKEIDIFIRQNESVDILKKVIKNNFKPFSSIVSSRKPFGLPTNFSDFLTTEKDNSLKVYANKKIKYLSKENSLLTNNEFFYKWKILAPKAIGEGNSKVDWLKPIISEPGSICTETYIMFGPFKSEEVCKNVVSFTQTRFFHFFMGLKKVTQDASSKVYDFIPLVNFDEEWSDKKLFDLYNFSENEIKIINDNSRSLDLES